MKVKFENPRIEYLGRDGRDENYTGFPVHKIKFELDMILSSEGKEPQKIRRGTILRVDEREMWSLTPQAHIPQTTVKIREPDNFAEWEE